MTTKNQIIADKAADLSRLIYKASAFVNYTIEQTFATISLSDIGMRPYNVNVRIGIDRRKEYVEITLVEETRYGADNIYSARVYADRNPAEPEQKNKTIKTLFYKDDIYYACKNVIRFAFRREDA